LIKIIYSLGPAIGDDNPYNEITSPEVNSTNTELIPGTSRPFRFNNATPLIL
jgi:hypothetical protein